MSRNMALINFIIRFKNECTDMFTILSEQWFSRYMLDTKLVLTSVTKIVGFFATRNFGRASRSDTSKSEFPPCPV